MVMVVGWCWKQCDRVGNDKAVVIAMVVVIALGMIRW